jgi:acyl CoA:acetate/3-ketoacid CoA transferase beta subunit
LTGLNCVDLLITDLGVFSRATRKDKFKLIELAPGVSREEISRKTAASYLE